MYEFKNLNVKKLLYGLNLKMVFKNSIVKNYSTDLNFKKMFNDMSLKIRMLKTKSYNTNVKNDI